MKKQILISAAVIGSIIIMLSYIIFNNGLTDYMHDDIDKRLRESVEPNIISFELQVQEQIKKVNTFAEFLSENWSLDKSVHLSLLKSAVDNNGLLRCAIAYPDGSFITHDNKNDGNVSKDAFFIANKNGEFFITDPRPAVVDATKRVILFAAPVLGKNNEFLGSVIYSYLCDDMDKIFNLKSMGGNMSMMIVNSKGELLIGTSEYETDGVSIVDNIRSNCSHKTHADNKCFALTGDSGIHTMSLKDSDGLTYIRYDKLKYNDWYLVSSISKQAATKAITYTSSHQRILTIIIFCVLFSFGILCLIMWLLQMKSFDNRTKALTLYAFKREAKKIFAARQNEDYVIVQLDVKNFKLINRIYTFRVGDLLIQAIAASLRKATLGQKSIFARTGADTFVLLLPYDGPIALNKKRFDFIKHFDELTKNVITTKVIFPTGQYILKETDYQSLDINDLLEKVNFAHKFAKQKWDVIVDYEEDIESSALLEKHVEDRMESAILDEEFTLFLQPKIYLQNEKITGAEALVRWRFDGKEYMYPTDFVPILERNGFIVQLDMYMFKCTARYLKNRIENNLELFPISVNFSRHHLTNEDFVSELCKIADYYEIPHKYLEIELTESAFIGNICDAIRFIDNLHNAGFKISMDDFGSGYSCFAQLKDLKIDILKIDKGFFAENDEADRLKAVISGIVKIAKDLNIETVAEGVEKKEQAEMLQKLGCDIAQGYYYARPMPAPELQEMVEKFNK